MFAYHCISLIQDVQFCQETHIRLFLEDHAMNLLRLFNINSLFFFTDNPKRSGIQKNKNALNGHHCTDF